VWAPVLDLAADELEAMVDGLAAQIDVPCLSLHGITPPPGYERWLAERISGADVEVWDEHGHYPHLVDPHRFLERLRTFDPLI
jgi:pimeloyl-ACP methyl ester carboxylesterase